MLFSRLTVNQIQIAFSYAGDIWMVDRNGGEARRLKNHPAEENFPVFSPDGSQIAFSRAVGGNWDVFVMPSSGGDARRLTFDPRGEVVNVNYVSHIGRASQRFFHLNHEHSPQTGDGLGLNANEYPIPPELGLTWKQQDPWNVLFQGRDSDIFGYLYERR